MFYVDLIFLLMNYFTKYQEKYLQKKLKIKTVTECLTFLLFSCLA